MSKKIAFVFPGQGSQSVGMLAELAESNPKVKEVYAEALEVLGYDLWDLVQNGPAEDLNSTEKTQPALLAAGIAVWECWKQNNPDVIPVVMAGHSLGEYTALVASGSIKFKDAIKLVETRGKLMQQAVPEGEGQMAAILGLDDEVIIEACKEAEQGQVVSAVNFNAPSQVVIAGAKAAVDRACELVKEKGAKKAVVLPVSVPSHCELMKEASEKLAAELDKIEIAKPEIPVLHNVDVQVAEDAAQIKDKLVKQLYCPVQWVNLVSSFADYSIEGIVESGPGKVLFGLNKRIIKGVTTFPVFDVNSLKKAETMLLGK
ncbi:MAG: [acyl-carrier-protein] S-malonyltransferase [Gammaproteobacteria bacterium]|nr:MAG: [acyl-carrier-protein] S-malonyltransferase [Gammaproteobacteria bacterium]